MLNVDKITTVEALTELRPVWNSLLAESASNTITLTWEWLTAWWEVFHEGRELRVLIVRDAAEVIGIAPLLKRATRHEGLLPCRRLEFLGSGEDEADEICSEYLDFIIRNGRESDVLQALMGYLLDNREDWDELLLSDMREDSPSIAILQKLSAATRANLDMSTKDESLYLRLPADWEAFLRDCPASIRRRIQRDRRSFMNSGGSLRIVEDVEGFNECFDALIKLHQARWVPRDKPGVFASEKFTRFHRSIAPKLLTQRRLKLFLVMTEERPVAALYAFVYNGRMQYYQSGFVEVGRAVLSPGTLVHSFAIQHAIEQALVEYDFLKGDAGGHKSRWNCQRRGVAQLRLARPGSREIAFRAANAITIALRGLKRAVKSAAAF